MKKIYFDIYGLPLEISADHSPLLETFEEDLKWFQLKNGNHKKNLIQLRKKLWPKTKKPVKITGLLKNNPATTYSPTQLYRGVTSSLPF